MKEHDTLARMLLVATAVAAWTSMFVAVARAEPKNELPFIRAVSPAAVAPDWFERYVAAHPYGASLSSEALPAGEPKAERPFTRPIQGLHVPLQLSTAKIASRDLGFRWRDAFVGAAAMTLIFAAAAAAFITTHGRRTASV